MYLSVQLVQIASSITTSRYENVDPPAPGAQTHCYECNLEASCGSSSSRLLCCKEKSGDIRWRSQEGRGGGGGVTAPPYYWSTIGSAEFLFISSICRSSSSYILLTLCLDIKGNKLRVIISRLLQGRVVGRPAAQQPSRLLL